MRALLEDLYARRRAHQLAKGSEGRKVQFICRDGGVGDILCTLPALEVLRKQSPDRSLIYLCNRSLTGVPSLTPAVEQVIGIRSNDRVARHLARMRPTLAPRYADELPGVLSSPAESLVAQMARSMGIAPEELGSPRLSAPTASLATQDWLASSLTPGRPLIAFHTGPTSPVRSWPQAHWQEMIEIVRVHRPDVQWMRVGPPNHFRQGGESCEVPSHVIDTRRALDGSGCLHAISRATLFVGVDSGLLHAALLFGLPALGLFGATLPSHRLAREQVELSFRCTTLTCAGCHHRHPRQHWERSCPRNAACMKEISPGEVAQRILILLGEIHR